MPQGISVAAPFLDFNGVGNGAEARDVYGGDKDSFGNIGPDYGIHLTNAQLLTASSVPM